jgi:membrane-associated phospholipid phosphatase
VILLLAYVAVTIGVVHRSPLLTVDRDVLRLDWQKHWPGVYPWIHTYVMLGQRGPATLVVLPWFVWRSWRDRTMRPLMLLGTSLLVLNLSVGVVKLSVGRLGPLRTHQVHAVFDGGNIFPSGHVSNAVVLYGVMAMLAVNHRRLAAVAAVVLSVTVGASTIYLDTHWLTDVVGGLMAGGLVLLTLPWLMVRERPMIAWLDRTLRRGKRYARAAPSRVLPIRPVHPVHLASAGKPVITAAAQPGALGAAVRSTVSADV